MTTRLHNYQRGYDANLSGNMENTAMQHYHESPLELNSSLSDSLGWTDEAETDRRALDDEFDRIYNDVDQQQHIHRTSFSYNQPINRRQQHFKCTDDDTDWSAGLNSYEYHVHDGSSNNNNQQSNRESICRMQTLPSPSTLLHHARLNNSAVMTPDSVSSQRRGILRNSTPVPNLATTTRNNHDGAITSRERSINRRRQRSSSRSVSRRRSRVHEDEKHNQSLFRGAQLLKEQLIRSMHDIDKFNCSTQEEQSNDDAATNTDDGADHADTEQDDVSIDFDYSRIPTTTSNNSSQRIEPVRNSSSLTDPSSINSRLESESERLDSLIQIFKNSSSVSSSTSQSNVVTPDSRRHCTLPCQEQLQSREEQQQSKEHIHKSSSAKENDEYPEDEESEVKGTGNSSTASPNSTCVDLNKAPVATDTANTDTTKSFVKQTSDELEYAQQYFQPKVECSTDAATIAYVDSPVVANVKHFTPQQQPSSTAIQLTVSQMNLQQQHHQHKSNDALSHARNAGSLWRSLVGNHVRFPSDWNEILPPSSPPLDNPNKKWSKWYYPARHRVRGDRKLNSRDSGVRSRRSGGRILMNLLVREMQSQSICREVVVGCFHPNAKGVRSNEVINDLEDVREVWMGVRWVIRSDCNEPALNCKEEDLESIVDGFLSQRLEMDYRSIGSPLGHRKAVNNENVRAVFGDQPPLTTVTLYEDEFAEIIKANHVNKLAGLPGLMLLKLFLFPN